MKLSRILLSPPEAQMLASCGVPIKDGGPVFLLREYGDVRDANVMRTVAYAKTRVIRSKAAQLRYVLHCALPAANANAGLHREP